MPVGARDAVLLAFVAQHIGPGRLAGNIVFREAAVLVGREQGLDLAARRGIALLQHLVGDQRDRAVTLGPPGLALTQRQQQSGARRADHDNQTKQPHSPTPRRSALFSARVSVLNVTATHGPEMGVIDVAPDSAPRAAFLADASSWRR